jgi:hypothetical protein
MRQRLAAGWPRVFRECLRVVTDARRAATSARARGRPAPVRHADGLVRDEGEPLWFLPRAAVDQTAMGVIRLSKPPAPFAWVFCGL